MKNVKNIIFDLGGVIMNLDVPKTISALREIGVTDIVNNTGHHYKYAFFYDFEIGKITPQDFINELRNLSSEKPSDAQLQNAWNAMIFDIPKDRVDFIKSLKPNYNIYLLSNTNAIHQKKFLDEFEKAQGFKFNTLFEKAYYSHEIKIRKPDEAIFTYVLKDSQLQAEASMFIDDSIDNIKAAEGLGLQTFHIKNYNLLTDFASVIL